VEGVRGFSGVCRVLEGFVSEDEVRMGEMIGILDVLCG